MVRRTSLTLPAALALLTLLVACGDSPRAAGAPTALPSPRGAAPATALATEIASGGTAVVEPVASTASVPTDALPRVVFERADGSSVSFPVEVPPRYEYGIGLSGRNSLDGRGMLFWYPEGRGNAGFWMKNTHIDLAIAFITVDGRISEIHEMTAESLEITHPVEPYEFAVEAPAGWYAAHQVAAGDAMRLEFELGDFVD